MPLNDVELIRALGRIEGRLEGIENEQKRLATMIPKMEGHVQERLNQLEKNESKRTGWAAGAGAVAAGAITFLAWLAGVFI